MRLRRVQGNGGRGKGFGWGRVRKKGFVSLSPQGAGPFFQNPERGGPTVRGPSVENG